MRGQVSVVGDTRVATNGYHYTKTEKGWRLTHHLMAEKKLGRSLKETERVVFADRNRKNLKPGNILVQVKGQSSNAKRKAYLVSRIQELQAQLRELN